MIATRFRSVGLVACVAAAALGCYMVSLKVASERGKLEAVERRILAARLDIRQLRTELGTRGRLTQLERWNVEVLGLAAPKASQYLDGEVQLASYNQPRLPPTVLNPAAPPGLDTAPARVVPVSQPAPSLATQPEPARPADPAPAADRPVLRQATYLKPPEDRPPGIRTVALLDAGDLADISRRAALEAAATKRPR